MTNILSLHNVKQKYRVTYDSKNGDKFVVHKQKKKLYFTCSMNGLYYHDTRKRQMTMINMVEDNESRLSKRQLDGARKAKELYATVGYPSMQILRIWLNTT